MQSQVSTVQSENGLRDSYPREAQLHCWNEASAEGLKLLCHAAEDRLLGPLYLHGYSMTCAALVAAMYRYPSHHIPETGCWSWGQHAEHCEKGTLLKTC